jgi:hypothetical protein
MKGEYGSVRCEQGEDERCLCLMRLRCCFHENALESEEAMGQKLFQAVQVKGGAYVYWYLVVASAMGMGMGWVATARIAMPGGVFFPLDMYLRTSPHHSRNDSPRQTPWRRRKDQCALKKMRILAPWRDTVSWYM